MMLFYPNRATARNSLKSHKLVDNGPNSKPNRRWARELNKPLLTAAEKVHVCFGEVDYFALAA